MFAQNPNFGLNPGLLTERGVYLMKKRDVCCLVDTGAFSGNLTKTPIIDPDLLWKQVYRDLYLAFAFPGQPIPLSTHDTRSPRRHIHSFTNICWSPTLRLA